MSNEALKLKWHTLYGQLLERNRIKGAWNKVKANKGSGGIDEITIEKFESNLDKNIEQIRNELKSKTYKSTPVRRVYIPKKSGGKRPLGIPILKDRIIQQELVDILQPKFEEIFHKCSCAYRPNYQMEKTIQLILWYIEKENKYVYDLDIKGFFDNIPHKELMKVLNKYIADGSVLDLIWQWLSCGYMEEGKYNETLSGTSQGGVISPLLANIYLNELDWLMNDNKIKFVRYADDMLMFAETEEEILKVKEIVDNGITSLGLEVATNKTHIVDFTKEDFNFVGFTFNH